MLIQKSLQHNVTHKKQVIGAHPIIHFFLTKLRIGEIISSYICQDNRQRLSVEKCLSVLIHNMLTHPLPMYEIADWIQPLDEQTVGLDPGDSNCINDDCIGKALERFYRGRHKDVFFHLVLRAIKLFEIDCHQIHQDTTTVTFYGKYDRWKAEQIMTYGINKDHRPDLKQLVLGMSVSADGAIPLVHQIYDGNQSDDRVHPVNHRQLRNLLQRADFTYVADCKLATEYNLSKITGCGGHFVSVMPRTWKEDEWFRENARQGNVTWIHLLSRPNNRKPISRRDHYYRAVGTYVTKQGYRLIWIRSSQKKQQDAQTRHRTIAKSLDALRKLQTRLNTYNLKTRKNIQEKIDVILTENQCSDFICYTIQLHREYEKRRKKIGRPKSGDPVIDIPKNYFSLSCELNNKAIQRASLTDGVFPLITDLTHTNAKKILEIYKYQPFLEKRHTQLKTFQQVTPVLLKKPLRVIAYLHMCVMALMVATIIERQLRIAMRKNSMKDIPIYPEHKPCAYPTAYDIVRLFNTVERYETVDAESAVTVFPAQLNKLQKQVLDLLEVPISYYQ